MHRYSIKACLVYSTLHLFNKKPKSLKLVLFFSLSLAELWNVAIRRQDAHLALQLALTADLLLQPGRVLGHRVSHVPEALRRNSSVCWTWNLVADEIQTGGKEEARNFTVHFRCRGALLPRCIALD